MAGTRLLWTAREGLGNIARELRIAITPVPQPDKWVFLVGCYNSGTTLLAELLGRHPEVSALPTEGHFITDQFVKDYEVGLPRMWAGREELFRLTEADTGPDPVRIKKQWGMRLDLRKPVLLEKSPPNTPRTRWLQAHFKPAYFVGILRNGYAVAEGISRKGDPKHLDGGWPIESSIWQWKRSNELLAEDAHHLDHFMWSRYEDFTQDPLTELNRICSFIGIAPFSSFDYEKAVSVHERNEAVRDLNEVSIGRLGREQILKINEVAAECLQRFGYHVIDPR